MGGLPDASALHRKLAGPWHTWGWAEELAAQNVEAAHALWRLLLMKWSKPGRKAPEPLRIPRPGDIEKKNRLATKSEMVAFFKGGEE